MPEFNWQQPKPVDYVVHDPQGEYANKDNIPMERLDAAASKSKMPQVDVDKDPMAKAKQAEKVRRGPAKNLNLSERIM